MEDRQERIRRRAYELWEAAGSPEGGGDEFWHAAERDIASTDPAIDELTPEATAMREVQKEHPEAVMKVAGRRRKTV